MRKSILSLASLMMLSATVSAQQVEGEVTMGANYVNNVFYNLETQDEHAVSKDIWDLAFYRNNAMDYGIKINDNKGGTLHEVGEIADYGTVEIANVANWTQLCISQTDYTQGAFDQGSDDREYSV